RAAGVNPVDVKSYSGAFGADPARLPIRLGAEAAGVVTAVGADTAGPAGPVGVGDEVIAYRAPGAYATELVVPAQAVVPKPIPVAYGPGLAGRVAVAAPGGVDAALDLVGTDEAWDVSMGVVTDRARIATIVAFGRGLQAGIKVLGGAPGADPGTEIRQRARLE